MKTKLLLMTLMSFLSLEAKTNLDTTTAMNCSMIKLVNGEKVVHVTEGMRSSQMFADYRILVSNKKFFYTPSQEEQFEESTYISSRNSSKHYHGILKNNGLFFDIETKEKKVYIGIGYTMKMYFECRDSKITAEELLLTKDN